MRKLLACALQFALWRDVLAQHAKHPLHLVVGGGDQVYNDEVFTYSESLRHWLTLGKQVRGTDEVLQTVFAEPFRHYILDWPVSALVAPGCCPSQGLLSHLPAICPCLLTEGPQSSHPGPSCAEAACAGHGCGQ